FKYSARPGTKADELYPDDVPEETKRRRNNDLLAVQNAESLKDHRRIIGRTVEILVEGPSKNAIDNGTGPIQLTGRSNTDHIVVFDGNPRLIGQFVSATINEASSFTLFGTVETGEHVGSCCETELTKPLPAPLSSVERIGLPLA